MFPISPEKKQFLRQKLPLLLAWPAICVGVGACAFVLLSSLLQSEREKLAATARTDAGLLSQTYAQQIGRTISGLDHITALLKRDWERSGGTLRLDRRRDEPDFNDHASVGLSLVNREGVIISTTVPGATGASVRDREYFKHHRANSSSAIRIGHTVRSLFAEREIVPVTRRLFTPDGGFGGIIIASANTQLLAEFANPSTLGQRGVLALVNSDGKLLVAKIGSQIDSTVAPRVVRKLPLDRFVPQGGLSADDWLADHDLRYLAAHKVPGYELRTVVGLAQSDVFLPLIDTRRTFMQIGIAGAALLAFFGIVATILTMRGAWRRTRDATVSQIYRVATEGANEGFYMWRPVYEGRSGVVDFELADCNERGAELYGRRRQDLIGVRMTELYKGGLREELFALSKKVEQTGFHEDEYQTHSESMATPAWIYRRFVLARDGFAVTLRDISERKRLEQETVRLAEQDPLTGLPNRTWLLKYLGVAIARTTATQGMLAVLFVDLDGFKSVNDSWGHSAGDELLHAVAERLRGGLRPSDRVARFGGDEFVVVVESLSVKAGAAEIARRIATALEEPFYVANRTCRIGASIGLSLFPEDGRDVETLIRNADIAMYASKSESKGRYRFFDRSFHQKVEHRLDTEQRLLKAIEADQLVLHYQVRVDAQSLQPVGMEALVRWQHPEKGLLYPADFIPVAESSDLILQLDQAVLAKACQQLSHWRAQGLPPLPVAVNLSARQFSNGQVSRLIEDAAQRQQLPISLLGIELTESTMVNNTGAAARELRMLREMGVTVHLDDFGTGYSALSLLHSLDLDVLKVDRSFTAQLQDGEQGEAFFRAIIAMAKSRGLRVVAEGVETQEQLRILRKLGCDEVQGYLVSPPVPAEMVPDILAGRAASADAAQDDGMLQLRGEAAGRMRVTTSSVITPE